MLEAAVARGELPPVEDRLPPEPMVVEPVHEIGRYGGTWHRMMSGVERLPRVRPLRVRADDPLAGDGDRRHRGGTRAGEVVAVRPTATALCGCT